MLLVVVGVRDALWLCGGVARGVWDELSGADEDPPGVEEDPPGVVEPPCFPPITAITAAAAPGVSGRPSGPHSTPLMSWMPFGRASPPLPPPWPPPPWRRFRTVALINPPAPPAEPFNAATLTAERPDVPVRLRTETLTTLPAVPPVPFRTETLTADRPLVPVRLRIATLANRPALPALAFATDSVANDRLWAPRMPVTEAEALATELTVPASARPCPAAAP